MKNLQANLRRILADEGLLRTARGRLSPAKKDMDRIDSMRTKASKSGQFDLRHMERLAKNMAKAIKDWKKAERRGSAAESFQLPTIAQIFFDVADVLKGDEADTPAYDWTKRAEKVYAIPMGSVNLTNGDNRVFNFVDTWGGEKSTVTIVDRMGRRLILVGSGGLGWRPGAVINLISDQTHGELGQGVVVKSVHGDFAVDLLDKVKRVSGKRSIPAYVLK